MCRERESFWGSRAAEMILRNVSSGSNRRHTETPKVGAVAVKALQGIVGATQDVVMFPEVIAANTIAWNPGNNYRHTEGMELCALTFFLEERDSR